MVKNFSLYAFWGFKKIPRSCGFFTYKQNTGDCTQPPAGQKNGEEVLSEGLDFYRFFLRRKNQTSARRSFWGFWGRIRTRLFVSYTEIQSAKLFFKSRLLG